LSPTSFFLFSGYKYSVFSVKGQINFRLNFHLCHPTNASSASLTSHKISNIWHMKKNRTLRFIILLVALLFMNIEAAHAGLIGQLRLYISAELGHSFLYYSLATTGAVFFLAYVIFSPVHIGSEKWSWYHYFSFNPIKKSFSVKKQAVYRISQILAQAEPSTEAGQ
jgi:hypothetical protein